MTSRASLLLAIVTAPVAVLRYARTVAARVLFGMGDAMMGAAWRVAPEQAPARKRERSRIVRRCVVCGATTELEEWLLEWQDRGGAT